MSFKRAALAVAYALICAVAPAQEGIEQKLDELRRQYRADMAAMRAGYEGRIAALEHEVSELRADVEDGESHSTPLGRNVEALIDHVGHFGHGGHGGHGPKGARAPEVRVVGDFVLAASNRDGSFERFNQFVLKEVEVGLDGRVDDAVAYHVRFHLDEEVIELEEAFGILDGWLPETLSLRFGRYNLDFGITSPLHEHELPFIDHAGVIQEYLGGSLRGTGAELHQRLEVDDLGLIRWSFGIVNGLDSDTHSVAGPAGGDHDHDDEGPEPFGSRTFDDFAFNGRLAVLVDTDAHSGLEIGVSAAWAPEVRTFLELPQPAGADPLAASVDLERAVLGADVTFEWHDHESGERLTIAGEFLVTRSRFLDEDDAAMLGATRTRTSFGFHGWGEYAFDHHWSIGVAGDRFQRAEDSSAVWWDVAGFVTWRVNESNRLRLEIRYFDDGVFRDEYFVVMAQWTVTLGSHDDHGHVGW